MTPLVIINFFYYRPKHVFNRVTCSHLGHHRPFDSCPFSDLEFEWQQDWR